MQGMSPEVLLGATVAVASKSARTAFLTCAWVHPDASACLCTSCSRAQRTSLQLQILAHEEFVFQHIVVLK
jgi:hypothetical protein